MSAGVSAAVKQPARCLIKFPAQERTCRSAYLCSVIASESACLGCGSADGWKRSMPAKLLTCRFQASSLWPLVLRQPTQRAMMPF